MKKLTFSVVQGNYFRQLLWKTKFLWLIKPCAVSVAGYILSFTVSFPLSMLELPLRLWRVSFSCQLHWHESSRLWFFFFSLYLYHCVWFSVCLGAEWLCL